MRTMRRFAPVLLALLLLAPPPAEPSCQTVYCQHRYQNHSRQEETELQRELLEDPTKRESWERLLRLLEYKPERERAIAGYIARWRWEPQPILDDLAAHEGRWAAERAAWLAAYRAALPEAGDGPCRQAEKIEPIAERVLFLQQAADQLPDSAELAACLARAWHQAEQPDAAVAALESFRDRHPQDRQALDALISLLDQLDRKAAWLQAMEERAAVFPEDPRVQAPLLWAHQELGQLDRRDALFEVLQARFSSPSDRYYTLCSGHTPGAREHRSWETECAERLLREGEGDLEGARRHVLSDRIHRRDWPALLDFVATRPPEQVLETWARIVDWIDEPRACAELGRFFDAGGFGSALAVEGVAVDPVPELARLLHRCGRTADGEALLAPWLPRAHPLDLRWSHGYPELFIAEVERRLAAAPGDIELVRALLDLRRQEGARRSARKSPVPSRKAPTSRSPTTTCCGSPGSCGG